jgi:hypothetical protein
MSIPKLATVEDVNRKCREEDNEYNCNPSVLKKLMFRTRFGSNIGNINHPFKLLSLQM